MSNAPKYVCTKCSAVVFVVGAGPKTEAETCHKCGAPMLLEEEVETVEK